jgi:hypothetical protein
MRVPLTTEFWLCESWAVRQTLFDPGLQTEENDVIVVNFVIEQLRASRQASLSQVVVWGGLELPESDPTSVEVSIP